MNILRNKKFVFMGIGSFVSSIGDNLYNLGITIAIYNFTDSVAAIAAMWLIRAIMRIPIQFISGIIADKYNKKYIIIWMNILSIPAAGLFIFMNSHNMIFIYILIFILQTTNDIETTSSVSILPEIVLRNELPEANSIFSVSNIIALLISPGLAGIIYKFWGINVLFIINSITFLVACLLYSLIKYSYKRISNNHEFTLFKYAKEGFKVANMNKLIIIIIMGSIPFSILGRLYEIYKVYIAENVLEINAEGIIYFSYAMAIGGILTPFFVKLLKKKINNTLTSYIMCYTVMNIFYSIWGIAPNLLVSLTALFIVGIFSSSLQVFVNSIIQKNIQKDFLGRVFSFYKIIIIFSAIVGIILAPIFLKILGAGVTIAVVSCIGIIFSIVVSRNNRKSGINI